MEEGALTGVDSEERVVPESVVRELEQKIQKLERPVNPLNTSQSHFQ
jgi:hypothetical protein